MTQEEFTALCSGNREKIMQSRKTVRNQILDAATGDDRENASAMLGEYGTGGEVEKEKLSADFHDIFMKEAESAEDAFSFDDRTPCRETCGVLHTLAVSFGFEPFEKMLPGFDERFPGSALNARKAAFLFDGITLMDDSVIQKLVREYDSEDLAVAFRDAAADTREKLFRNMSKRAAKMLKEDIEFMVPLHPEDAEASRNKIIVALINLQNGGEA